MFSEPCDDVFGALADSPPESSAGSSEWAEPGCSWDPACPNLPVPACVRVKDEGNKAYWAERGDGGDVSDAEVDWMASQRPLVYNAEQLAKDYGADDAAQISAAVAAAGMELEVAGALAWPGVATRWQRFFAWWHHVNDTGAAPSDARAALSGFAKAVGRVTTYRALALDDAGCERIFAEDEIFPSGRLKPGVDAAALQGIIEEHGVEKVAVVRLYISNMPKIGGIDPSISLHDDWQTTSVIASGYASARKRIHLFELSVPAVESLGWTLKEVGNRAVNHLGAMYGDHTNWFCFPGPAAPSGVWFDARLQRTERYGLYSVPHLRNRLLHLYVFDSIEQLRDSVEPFVTHTTAAHDADPGLTLKDKTKGKRCNKGNL